MYTAADTRYDSMAYRKCGKSGLKLSELSLGFWHNFGTDSDYTTTKKIVTTAFDNGITSFDLANNYGPIYGSAEERFGAILKDGIGKYRDEMCISSKAGWDMWPGPYGDLGSKKYLIASCDQSLKRMGLEYVDIFYHHRPDYDTPLEETMEALATLVRSDKALYVAVSNYPAERAIEAKRILEENWHISPILNQVSYSMLNRKGDPHDTEFKALEKAGIGVIAYSPLSQGRLTDKYLTGVIPEVCRAKENKFLTEDSFTPEMLKTLNDLNDLAKERGQKLSQLALTWALSRTDMTSCIVGARNKDQLLENLKALATCRTFTEEENKRIDEITGCRVFRR